MSAVLRLRNPHLRCGAGGNPVLFSSVEQPIKDAVITVPAFFNQAERRAVLQAARMAGLKVLQLINDNTATALSYGVFRRKDINSTAQVSWGELPTGLAGWLSLMMEATWLVLHLICMLPLDKCGNSPLSAPFAELFGFHLSRCSPLEAGRQVPWSCVRFL